MTLPSRAWTTPQSSAPVVCPPISGRKRATRRRAHRAKTVPKVPPKNPRERARTSTRFRFREVDRVRVKGKAEPCALFELLSGPDGVLATYVAEPTFAAALAAYRRGDLVIARRGFADFAEQNPKDRTTALYLERIADLGESPPPGFDGVMTFRSK